MTTEVKGTRASADGLLLGTPDRVSDAAFLTVGARRITVEEALRLQGFSDAWPLQGTVEQRYTQVGNAVPPPLAAVVARTVRARLSIASRA